MKTFEQLSLPPLKPLAKLGGTTEEILARSELARAIVAKKEEIAAGKERVKNRKLKHGMAKES